MTIDDLYATSSFALLAQGMKDRDPIKASGPKLDALARHVLDYVFCSPASAPAHPAAQVVESLWVPAKPEHSKIGWTYDFDQTERLSRAAEAATGYDATMEIVEFVMGEADRRHKSALASPTDADAAMGEWREIETDYQLKGRRKTPTYFPATGEVCEVSGPNCDDANGYTWMTATVLWQNDIFVLYGQPGFWPNLHKREHILIRPLTAAKAGEDGR